MNERPVFTLQSRLRQLSELDGRILPVIPDGNYGPNTHASVRSFQEAYGYMVTGETDLATWNAIERTHSETVPPTNGGDLYVAQAMLLALSGSYPALKPPQVTGRTDMETQAGLRWIQKASGRTQTGDLDPWTWFYLTALYKTI